MFDVLCVTNRKLCSAEFMVQIERIAKAGPAAVILREKDLPEREYRKLAAAVMDICNCLLYTSRCV